VPRTAVIAVLIAATLLTASREAAACISGPGNGNEESGDCLDDVEIDFGPKGNVLFMLSLAAIPAISYDFKAMGTGVRGMSKGWHIMGILTGTLTVALTAGYVTEAGISSDDGLAVGLGGLAIGAPAVIGGIVGLALARPNYEAARQSGVLHCSAPGCRLSMPMPRVRQQGGGTTVSLPLVDGRW
jgi:hypothetical protein